MLFVEFGELVEIGEVCSCAWELLVVEMVEFVGLFRDGLRLLTPFDGI